MTKASDSAQVRAWVESGWAIPIQANVRGGYVIYEFIGGVYDGYKMRLYPPFKPRLGFGDDVYVWGPPKNGRSKRLTYRAEE
jgi:hypothetical protein